MTPAQAAELLAIAATFDRRTVGDFEARAWAKALTGLRLADCAEAIQNHYTNSTDWLMPAHVRAEVKRIRAERVRSVPSSALEPADVDPNDIEAYQAARLELVRRIADGEPLPERPALAASVAKSRAEAVENLARRTVARLPRVPRASA
jgi:hypothetical protein